MSASAPIVIAHRGASGYLPEHSLEAKVLAFGQGADYLEQDVIATRDGELVVLHDLYLDDVSDVRMRYPERARADGRCYVIDFDLAELETLRFGERRRPGETTRVYAERFSKHEVGFDVVSLRKELTVIGELNRSTGRRVGVYPEIKSPDWHREQGFDLAAAMLDMLREFGYESAEDPVFVQCFEPAELTRVRDDLKSELKLVQLIDEGDAGNAMLSTDGLARIARYAQAVAPHYSSLVEIVAGVPRTTDALARIVQAGLETHPYTFRRDAPPANLSIDYMEFLSYVIGLAGVHGLFTDHPDIAVRACRAAAASP
jgi:glycerophosphoryl diester phosphodiesterase